MEFALICMIAAGLSGGFINGLAGFGTGLFALGWLLQVLPPHEAVAIVVACSVLVSLPGVWKVRMHISLARQARFLKQTFGLADPYDVCTSYKANNGRHVQQPR